MTCLLSYAFFFFFFQAEDGIRDVAVTGVQTCALPISLIARASELAEQDFRAAFAMKQKQARNNRLVEIRNSTLEKLTAEAAAADRTLDANAVKEIFFNLESKIVRSQILDGEPRIDGRDTRTVRPIGVRVGWLPRTHGSARFTRRQ